MTSSAAVLDSTNDETTPSTYRWYADGQFRDAPAGTFEDHNPYTGEVHAHVARCGRAEAADAVAAADRAFHAWSQTSPAIKAELFHRAAAVVHRRRDELVAQLARETGAAAFNAGFQVDLLGTLMEQVASWGYNPTGESLPSDLPGARHYVERRPLGVVVNFVPWNGASLLSWRSALAPLVFGNTVVIKPSELAPLSAGVLIAEVAHEAGFPPGVINVVTHAPGEAGPIADEFFENPAVRCLNFIGSVATGRYLAERAGKALKRTVMELGGYNPLLVMDDVDLDYAVRVATFSAFWHQGQVCMNARKILVHERIYEEFTQRLASAAQKLPMGDPSDPTTFIGPLITPAAVEQVDRRVREATDLGARALCGAAYEGQIYSPTVLVDVPDSATINHEETFGPVVVVQPVRDEDEAIDIANRPMYGLCAGVLADDQTRALKIAARLQAGAIRVNMVTISDEIHLPLGGVRDSGWGRSGPTGYRDDFTDVIAITIQSGQQQLPID